MNPIFRIVVTLVAGGCFVLMAYGLIRLVKNRSRQERLIAEVRTIGEWFWTDSNHFTDVLKFVYEDAYDIDLDVVSFSETLCPQKNGPYRIRIDRNDPTSTSPNNLEIRILGMASIGRNVYVPCRFGSEHELDHVILTVIKR